MQAAASPMGTESSDSEADALQSLLEAFPAAPVELIASAFVDAHSDQELAAEIIATSLNGVSTALCSNNMLSAAPTVPVDKTASPSSRSLPAPWRRPHPRPPTLEEFFPSSAERNAWAEPLRQDMLSQNEQGPTPSEVHSSISTIDFPSLEKTVNNGKASAPLSRSVGSHNRSRGGTSAAFGLASSARIRNHRAHPIKASTSVDSTETLKQVKEQKDEAQETSFWPTEAEASLLSMLGNDVDFTLEAIRDVLGFFKGDIQKSLKALQQMYPPLPSDVQIHEKQSTTLCEKKSTSSEDVAEVRSNIKAREVNSMKKVNDGSTLHVQAMRAYETFEKAILKHESSSMKWVVERLCSKYPHADMTTLLDVLRATNFDLNDADRMMQEICLHEESSCRKKIQEPYKVAVEILESLFNKPQEATDVCNGDHKATGQNTKTCKRDNKKTPIQIKESCPDGLEAPKWKAVTSADVELLGDKEEKGHTQSMMQVKKVEKSSEIDVCYSQGETKSYGDWNDYERHQASAKQHWKTMQSYFSAATAAYASSDFQKSEVLTEKGNMYKQLSMEAKERANACFLEIQNQQNEADFTLDLREQHIPEALQLLRFHLRTFSSIPSCYAFTVLMGSFENPKPGHKKIREEVIGYLEKKCYKWVEISPYNLQILLAETREHSKGGYQV